MARQVTRIERKRVLEVVEHELDYKKLQTPEEWHQLALHWNWDDGVEPLLWVTRQPLCDRGTALYIYWGASPTWLYQFKDRMDVLANEAYSIEIYDLIKEIEVRYTAGFYTRQQIRIDPRNATYEGDDLTVCSHGKALQQKVPGLLHLVSPGTTVPREDLVKVTIRALNKNELSEVAQHVEQGYRELTPFAPEINYESLPEAIVEAITRAAETFGGTLAAVTTVTPDDPILELGWLWADQLRRSHNWEWQAWDYESGASIGIVSPDKQYLSFPPILIHYVLNVKADTKKINTLFTQLADVRRTQDLSEAYGNGWVMLMVCSP